MNLNKFQGIGRLGKNPEMKYTATGKPVTSFSVAIKEKWGTGDDKKEKTTWVTVKVWGKLAEICNQYLEVGQQIYFEGRLDISKSEDGKYWTSVVANEVQFGAKANGSQGDTSSGAPVSAAAAEEDDEIPF